MSDADLLDETDARSLLVLYATETGNALDAAEQVAREALRQRFTTRLASTDAYPLAELVHEERVLFVVATTGAGAAPRSLGGLWAALLRADLPADLFDGLAFAVFGLGDTAYARFCWPAKVLARRLAGLGAHELHARGEGDEQHPLGADGALGPWMAGVFHALAELCPLPDGVQIADAAALPPPRITIVGADHTDRHDPLLEDDGTYHLARVKGNDRITARDWFQDVRHIEFDFEDDIQYKPGDVAVIHSVAPADDVVSFLASMGWADQADQAFAFESSAGGLPVPAHTPQNTTLRELFTRYLDVNAVPRRSFFRLLRHFTQNELEREKLDDFCSAEGADDLYEYCYRVRRTVREVVTEFRSARVPREYIFDLFPPLRPREFSIASSVKVYPKQVHLCVAIVKYKTKLRVPRRGVCTTYLASLLPGDCLRIGIQSGIVALPQDPSVPVICVGPGTGIAPMRALLAERIHAGATDNTLYFGCRSAARDHHYAHEWATHAAAGRLAYRAAFSRDGPEGVARTYVQDLMQQDEERLWALVGESGASVFISGSANQMPVAVKAAIEAAARNVGRLGEAEAKEFMKSLELQGRLVEECWS